jgi:hypothetical protein
LKELAIAGVEHSHQGAVLDEQGVAGKPHHAGSIAEFSRTSAPPPAGEEVSAAGIEKAKLTGLAVEHDDSAIRQPGQAIDTAELECGVVGEYFADD